MITPSQAEVSTPPKGSPEYVCFVQQSRRVLGFPEKPDPKERLNPSLDGLMIEAFYRIGSTSPKPTN